MCGMMVECTQVNTKTTKSMGMVSISGLIIDATPGIGTEENSMV